VAVVAGHHAASVSGHHAAEGFALVGAAVAVHRAAAVAEPYVAAVAEHHAADAFALAGAAESGHHAADDPSQYDYTVRALYHPSSHTYTNHTCPNAVFDPMSASCHRNHCSVFGNILMAHSEYIPAVEYK